MQNFCFDQLSMQILWRHRCGRNLLVSRALDNVLSSTELSYCAYRTDYELEVDIDRVQNELLSLKPSKSDKIKEELHGQRR